MAHKRHRLGPILASDPVSSAPNRGEDVSGKQVQDSDSGCLCCYCCSYETEQQAGGLVRPTAGLTLAFLSMFLPSSTHKGASKYSHKSPRSSTSSSSDSELFERGISATYPESRSCGSERMKKAFRCPESVDPTFYHRLAPTHAPSETSAVDGNSLIDDVM